MQLAKTPGGLFAFWPILIERIHKNIDIFTCNNTLFTHTHIYIYIERERERERERYYVQQFTSGSTGIGTGTLIPHNWGSCLTLSGIRPNVFAAFL